MKKRSLINYSIAIIAILVISIISIIIISFLGKFEYILSIISIAITCILGVTTYKQVDTQLRLDIMDKTPFINLITEECDDEPLNMSKNGGLAYNEIKLFVNKKYMYAESYVESTTEALLKIRLKNSSDVNIRKIDISYKNMDSENYKKIENYRVQKAIAKLEGKGNVEVLKNLDKVYNATPIFGVQSSKEFFVFVKIPIKEQELRVSLKLTVDTVNGYVFDEVIDVLLFKVGLIKSKGIIYLVAQDNIKIESNKARTLL